MSYAQNQQQRYYPYNNGGNFSRAPQGYAPPFQGPPPIPSNVKIPQQDWAAGQWLFNTAYNHSHRQAQNQAPWMPGQAWVNYSAHSSVPHGTSSAAAAAAASAAASFNPYKRQVRAPSASYLAMPLIDNPLGLSGMVPREEVYGQDEESDVPHTPWIWNPRGLVPKDTDEGQLLADFEDPRGGKLRQPRGDLTRPRSSSTDTSSVAESSLSSSRGSTPARQGATDTRQMNYTSAPVTPTRPTNSHPNYVNSASASSSRRGSASDATASAHHVGPSPLGRPREPQIYAPARDRDDRQSPPATAPAASETFTAQRELKPTFSTNIVRTPDHYRSGSVNPSMSSLTSEMTRMSTGSSPSPLSRQSSTASSASFSSLSGVSTFSEEPGALSPIQIGPTPMPEIRTLDRGHSMPAILNGSFSSSGTHLGAIPETSTPPRPAPRNIYQQSPTRSEFNNNPTLTRSSTMPSFQPFNSSSSHRRSRPPSPNAPGPERRSSTTDVHMQIYQTQHGDRRSSTTDAHTPSRERRMPTSSIYQPPTGNSTNAFGNRRSRSSSHSPPDGVTTQPPSPELQDSPQHKEPSPSELFRLKPLPDPPVLNEYYRRQMTPAASSSSANSSSGRAVASPVPTSDSPFTAMRSPPPFEAAPSPDPGTYKSRALKGFWNQRGDHLTPEGYLVYAPPEKQYPSILKDYPVVEYGFKDQAGTVQPETSWPELPQSLPRHGRPPVMPYDAFLVYEYTY